MAVLWCVFGAFYWRSYLVLRRYEAEHGKPQEHERFQRRYRAFSIVFLILVGIAFVVGFVVDLVTA